MFGPELRDMSVEARQMVRVLLGIRIRSIRQIEWCSRRKWKWHGENVRLIDDHGHALLAVGTLRLCTVDPYRACVIDGHRKSALGKFSWSCLQEGKESCRTPTPLDTGTSPELKPPLSC